MTSPEQVPFDTYLDSVFASPQWLEACVGMLAVFLENIDSCRDDIDESLPESAPSIVDQVVALNARAQRMEHHLRSTAEQHGPAFQTPELGAVLWWVGMAAHKAGAAGEHAREHMTGNAWEDAFFEIHTLMYETMSALSLLSVADSMLRRMEADPTGGARPN